MTIFVLKQAINHNRRNKYYMWHRTDCIKIQYNTQEHCIQLNTNTPACWRFVIDALRQTTTFTCWAKSICIPRIAFRFTQKWRNVRSSWRKRNKTFAAQMKQKRQIKTRVMRNANCICVTILEKFTLVKNEHSRMYFHWNWKLQTKSRRMLIFLLPSTLKIVYVVTFALAFAPTSYAPASHKPSGAYSISKYTVFWPQFLPQKKSKKSLFLHKLNSIAIPSKRKFFK